MCREEGVVLKDLDSKWEPSDRGPKWLKLKPDYIQAESDLDVLIIGEHFFHEKSFYGAFVMIFEARNGDCYAWNSSTFEKISGHWRVAPRERKGV